MRPFDGRDWPALRIKLDRGGVSPLMEERCSKEVHLLGYLRNYTSCPSGLRNFWLGWSGKDMSDHYDKIREDAAFRREVSESVGIGFELPKPAFVPCVGNVPNSSDQVELVTP